MAKFKTPLNKYENNNKYGRRGPIRMIE